MINRRNERIAAALFQEAGVERYYPLEDGDPGAFSAPLEKIVAAPYPKDDTTLAILAHEAGHVATTEGLYDRGAGLFALELMATKWAEKALRKLGVEITAPMRRAWFAGLLSYYQNARHDAYVARQQGVLEPFVNYLKELSHD